MVRRVARPVSAGLAPAARKKMVMDIFKRFKDMGDGLLRGGKHQVMLAAEGYNTVVLEDADDAELTRIYTKYQIGSWLKQFGKTAREDPHMRQAADNLNRVSGRLLDADGYIRGSMDLLVEALGFMKQANANISDEVSEELEKEIVHLIKTLSDDVKAASRQIQVLRLKAKECREQYESELDSE
jgi:hypothetical protein